MLKKLRKTINEYRQFSYQDVWKRIGGVSALLDCMTSQLFLGTCPSNYIYLEFWRKSHWERKTYLLSRKRNRIYHYLKSHTTAEQFARIKNKLQFNRFFRDFIHREFLYAAECDEETIRAFIEKHGVILAKEEAKMMGKGIRRITKEEADSALLKQLISGQYLLEEYIVQHPALAKINSSSVNTVRIATVIDAQKHAHVAGACLRCGAPGSYVDNFHAGGVAYPIDTDLGIVVNVGKSANALDRFFVHPGSDIPMIGFQIPNWDILISQVIKAAEMVPEMLFLGWDIAITEDGVEFVEANTCQDSDLFQFDHKGKRELILNYLPVQYFKA